MEKELSMDVDFLKTSREFSHVYRKETFSGCPILESLFPFCHFHWKKLLGVQFPASVSIPDTCHSHWRKCFWGYQILEEHLDSI